MSANRLLWVIAAALLAAGGPAGAQGGGDAALAAFATGSGLQDVSAFVATVDTLRASGHLPPPYVTKEDAERHGWHGGGLCTLWPGHVIGGDVFDDAGTPLPSAPGRVYHEADLDSTCSERGPKRLVYSSDGILYLTVDHYVTFVPVP
ncbi:MAG: ribonuclease [Alphaproteobacteria bacterium]|nr:ribonuclease [Alphaproteobacteria bacterium]MBV9863130.1 ribonuclease [Alphaproteobacteria bacterium]